MSDLLEQLYFGELSPFESWAKQKDEETMWFRQQLLRGEEQLRALLDEDAAYAPIYQRILRLCAADGGTTTPTINNAVDHDPLVQKPRFYAPHFVDRLEKCDALAWRKAWCITDIGRAGLDMLADVVDEGAPAAAQPETPEVPAPAASKED